MSRITLASLPRVVKMRWQQVLVSIAVVAAFSTLLFLNMDSIFPRATPPDYLPVATSKPPTDSVAVAPDEERYAYVTWLSSTVDADSDNADDLDADIYFVATRILVWQILHDPTTKTSNADMVVMVGPDVDEPRRERLRRDGAIVRPIELVHTEHDSWIVPEEARWRDIMSKLRVWEMEEYSHILMLDGDMLLQSPLDGIFSDPGAQTHYTKTWLSDDPKADLPETYMLGTYSEIKRRHSWPPKPSDPAKSGYFNGGFFLLRPDRRLFNYFVSLLDQEGRFDPAYMEQNLLNYAFRWDGPMPWREINGTWNIRFTNQRDMEGGAVSMHEKWWKSKAQDAHVEAYGLRKRWEMHGFYIDREKV
jgi:alpha-N-acetylglucosamine transferase